ncbi:hypothetical protein [Streptomyces sp. PSKA30]|uniref:hypothetical protein n=1 Tax=Streptomyces sp. PSKA30 TaxID=2874597 RepID=UPI001CD15C7D|nr:hypothetical protein [Streptomyces sp. PSKA30]MBZ9645315.1 hypothetical protein [Streptomyces sp. PSKA30]
MSVERATEVMHSAGVGTVITLMSLPEDARDLRTSHTVREMVINTLAFPPAQGHDVGGAAPVAGSAMALRAALDHSDTAALSPGERVLLHEWLNQLADAEDGDG